MGGRRWARSVVALALALACASCGEGKPQGEAMRGSHAAGVEKPAEHKPKIGLVLKTQTNPFFVTMERGARRAEADLGVELVVKGGSQENLIQEQIQLVEELIEEKVDAMAIAPADSKGLLPVVQRAQAAGIYVVNIDNRLDPGLMAKMGMKPIAFAGVDNEAGAYAVAKSVSGRIKRPTEVGMLLGLPQAENGRQREAGARRAFAENPALRVVEGRSADWKVDEGRDVAKGMFERHPGIGLLFCANDMMAIGAAQYLAESGRKGVLVVGYDAIDEAVAEVRSGRLAATVDQQAARQGYVGVEMALRGLRGEKLPAQTMIETKVVDRESLGK